VLVTGISVSDLLSFRDLEVGFEPGLNVVVGQNDIGKSNVIRLIRLVRSFFADPKVDEGPAPFGFEQRYVRLGGSGTGRVSVGVSFNESAERALLLSFLRAVAASGAPRVGSVGTEETISYYQQVADFVEGSLDLGAITSLFDGHLVLQLDARQPTRWALSYEFSRDNQLFHVGLSGHGVAQNNAVRGPLDMARPHSGWTSLNLAGKIGKDKSPWTPVSFTDLLPLSASPMSWDMFQPEAKLPLTLQLARELGLAADNSVNPNFLWVLRRLISRSIVTTENLRRPPEDVVPVAVEVQRWPHLIQAAV
jgi:hypothetical protein